LKQQGAAIYLNEDLNSHAKPVIQIRADKAAQRNGRNGVNGVVANGNGNGNGNGHRVRGVRAL